ncbi:unnamed protein product [Coregonus sp. 'balchen']|nr:unnamed protein product [Coregonus sp. 'balchen']
MYDTSDPSSADSTCQVITETGPDTTTPAPSLTPPPSRLRLTMQRCCGGPGRRARVEVVFPGLVTQEGCFCRFLSEILKCILYQRQQLPMTSWCTLRTDSKLPCRMRWWWVGGPVSPPQEAWTGGGASVPSKTLRRFLQQLEVLFSLSLVPRVLLLLGGSLLPKELYEVNIEELTATTVMVLAHRDCGVGWFRAKLDFTVPTRLKRQVSALSCDTSSVFGPFQGGGQTGWQDCV